MKNQEAGNITESKRSEGGAMIRLTYRGSPWLRVISGVIVEMGDELTTAQVKSPR